MCHRESAEGEHKQLRDWLEGKVMKKILSAKGHVESNEAQVLGTMRGIGITSPS